MNWRAKVPINLVDEPSLYQKFLLFLGHYDCRVYLTEGAFVDIGGGSLPVTQNIKNIPGGFKGSLGEIGRFCEFADSAQIMADGEHENDRPVNIGLTAFPIIGGSFLDKGLKAPKPIKIGGGVVISADAIVLSGVEIGDGAVIGANATVTHAVAPSSIVAGSPARVLRKRQDFAPWWDFGIAYFCENLERIQDLALQNDGHEWRRTRPRFVIKLTGGGITVGAFLEDGAERPISQAPATVREYLSQAFTHGGPKYWLADCWPD